MLVDPPIDKIIKMADCRYELVCAVSKRARDLMQQEGDYLKENNLKPISVAAKEIYEGKVLIIRD
jgi:DNA-directed RNA polymerase omega subunit